MKEGGRKGRVITYITQLKDSNWVRSSKYGRNSLQLPYQFDDEMSAPGSALYSMTYVDDCRHVRIIPSEIEERIHFQQNWILRPVQVPALVF
ncbi:hypothetical protein TNCV_1938841 [Trichonephila clavipes]|nr:hypothetical protein TNCV_1938841 [Trichonephila clavipes]